MYSGTSLKITLGIQQDWQD